MEIAMKDPPRSKKIIVKQTNPTTGLSSSQIKSLFKDITRFEEIRKEF